MMLKRVGKKANMFPVLLVMVILFSILILGFVFSIGGSIFDFAADTITPIITDIGNATSTSNISQAANYVVVPVNVLVQAAPWIIGFMYVAALIFSVVFVVSSKDNASPMYMGVYFMLTILLIFTAIIISNMYQDILVGGDEIATRLGEQTLMNYMILYSPFILTLIALMSGVFLFTNRGDAGNLT